MTHIVIYRNGTTFADELNGDPRDAFSDNMDHAYLPPGTKIRYTAKAYDSDNNISAEIETYVHVGYVDSAPTASVSPGNLATYIGGNIGLAVTASDPNNDLARVELWEWADENVGGGPYQWTTRKVASVEKTWTSQGGGAINNQPYNEWGGKFWNWRYSYFAVAWDVSGVDSIITLSRHSYVDLTNSSPAVPTLTPSQTAIQIGQQVVLTGVYSDIDINTTHLYVWWQYRASPSDLWGAVNTSVQNYYPSGTGSQTLTIPFQPSQIGYYRVWTRAQDPYGSTTDIEVALTVQDVPPQPQTGVQVAAIQWNQLQQSFQMQVTWNKSTSTNVTDQWIYWRPAGGSESSASVGVGPAGDWITGLSPVTTYYVYLKANNGFGSKSVASNEASATTPARPPIISSPVTATVALGTSFYYTVVANPTPTSVEVVPNNDTSVSPGVIRGFPPGISFSPASRVISGVPTAPGTYSLKISATNGGGATVAILHITVTDPSLHISSALDIQAARGAIFDFQITASQPPTAYSANPLEGSSYPPGVVFNSSAGKFTGIPAVSGTYFARVTVTTNAGNCEATVKITVIDPPAIISSAAATGKQGQPFSHQIAATNLPTYTLSGTLPAGLQFNPKTGTLSGVPTSPGTSVVTVTATNVAGSASQTLTIVITGAPPAINSATTVSLTVGAALNYQITATNSPTSFQVVEAGRSSGLPVGLSFAPVTATLSGSLANTGSYYLKLTATNAFGSGEATLRISVTAVGASVPPDISGTTLAAALPPSFAVDNRGAANYSVPLELPSGRAGLQPALAISYNSGAGNGPLGIGASLATGFPHSITRGRSILARDAMVKGVNFDADDKLYLDGKRLVVVSGTYGEAGSVYRTEVDSFVTVTSYGTGNNIVGFRLMTKNGLMMCFGKGVEDRAGSVVYSGIDGHHVPADETGGRALTWALKWVEDLVGNYVEFRYDETTLGGGGTNSDFNLPTGEHLLTSIRYTGNRALSVAPRYIVWLRHNNLQNLSLVNGAGRPDEAVIFQSGRFTVSSARLDNIAVAETTAALLSPPRAFWFKYDTGAGLLRLVEVVRRDTTSSGSTVLRTQLEWPGGAQALTPAPTTYPQTISSTPTNPFTDRLTNPAWRGDFNSDGRSDVLFRTGSTLSMISRTDSGGWTSEVTLPVEANPSAPITDLKLITTGDFNGDGRSDLVWAHTRLVNPNGTVVRHGGWYVSLAKPAGVGFEAPSLMVANSTSLGSDKVTPASAMALDLDGDGRDEFIFQTVVNVPNIDLSWLNEPSTYVDSVLVEAAPRASASSTILPNGTLYQLRLSPQTGTWEEKDIPPFYKGSVPMSLQRIDLDGDGRADFIATLFHVPDPSSAGYTVNLSWTVQVYRNLGQNGAGQTIFTPTDEELMAHGGAVGTAESSAGHLMLSGDVNGDGLDDLVIFTDGNGWSVFLSTGNGTFDKGGLGVPLTVAIGGNPSVKTYFQQPGNASADAVTASDGTPMGFQVTHLEGFGITGALLLDVNGDGKKDFAWYSPSAGWRYFLAGRWGFDTTTTALPLFAGSADTAVTYLAQRLNGGAPELIPYQMTCDVSAMDARGNGRDSLLIVQRNVQDHWWVRAALAENVSADLFRIAGVTDALGARLSIGYDSISNEGIYTSGVPVSYPIRETRRQTVVSNVWKDNGGDFVAGASGENQHYSYQYAGARFDAAGRGFLGFHSFVTLDQKTKLFKYQFLAQSFPMTGLTTREETYRSMGNGQFRCLSSHDNTVVFDEVVRSSSDREPWGTLYPFVSKAVEYRWEDSPTAHFTLTATGSSSMPEALFPSARPSGDHVKITAESWFDLQSKTGAAQTSLGNGSSGFFASDTRTDSPSGRANTVTGVMQYASIQGLSLPKEITYGNLTQLRTRFDNTSSTGEKIVNSYYDPTSNGLTGLLQKTETFVWSTGYGTESAPERAPDRIFTYWGNTAMVASETVDATDNKLDLTTTYTRDTRGRVTATEIAGYNDAADIQHIGSYVVSEAETTTFDDRFDLPTVTKNSQPYSHATVITYHPLLGLPESVTDRENGVEGNRPKVTTAYDTLGRVTQKKDHLRGLQTDTSYALTTGAATNWTKTQAVAPPAGHTGVAGGVTVSGVSALTLSSAYAVETKQLISGGTTTTAPTTWIYYDRLGRVIRTVRENFSGKTVTDTAYNSLGQVIAVSLPYAESGSPTILWTKTDYDALGRVSKVTVPNGTVTTTSYSGRATAVTVDAPLLGGVNPAPQTNSSVVDAKGRTIAVWNADNVPTFVDTVGTTGRESSIAFSLDGFGRMRKTTLRGQSSLPIEAKYDALGRQIELNDPDKGRWLYLNDALGRVVWQKDSKLTETTFKFDRLGRPLSRVTIATNDLPGADPTNPKSAETAIWKYYDKSVTATSNPGLNLTASGTGGWIGAPHFDQVSISNAPGYQTDRVAHVHYYDTFGRPEIELSRIDGQHFYTKTEYDSASRPKRIWPAWQPDAESAFAPSSAAANWGYVYNYDESGNDQSGKGYVTSVTDTDNRLWWSNPVYDHLDRVESARKGPSNKPYHTRRTYRAEDGVLTAIKTGTTLGSTTLQDLSFDYDGLGNLKSRSSPIGTETLSYDDLNRLTFSSKQGTTTYFDNGNIRNKPDVAGIASVSDYSYYPNKPHAVQAARGITYGYDANGNINSRTGGGETWSFSYPGFDKPRWMAKTVGTMTVGSEFVYDAARSRVIHVEFDGMAGGAPLRYKHKKIYAAGAAAEVDYKLGSGEVTWLFDRTRLYVPAPDGTAGAMTFKTGAGTPEAHVYHHDHLGSLERITPYDDNSNNPMPDQSPSPGRPSIFSYDAWGEHRDPTDWLGKPTTTALGGHDGLSPRGFTGHEMLDDLGLVHMNGRIYDPLLGRFLSADTVVDGPYSLQGYNRYSYVHNNPLTHKDETGHFISALITVGFAAYDTYQYSTGKISGKEYAANMALNGAALIADVASGGAGGGMVVRGASMASRAKNAVVATARAVDKADTIYSTAEGAVRTAASIADGDVQGTLVNGVLTAVGAKASVDAGNATKRLDAADIDAKKLDAVPQKQPSCFARGTLVLTARGLVPIEDIKVGDIVLAHDSATGGLVERKVLETPRHFTFYWVEVTVGGETTTATRFHRFWVESLGDWVEAIHLKPGMVVLLADGTTATVEAVKLRELAAPEDTFNLVVEIDHNYFVGSLNSVLVHNGTPQEEERFRRRQNEGDVTLPSERAARREAFRQNDVPTSQANNFTREVDPDSRRNPNLQGPDGEPSEIIKTKDVNGKDVEIKHHSNGHEYDDVKPKQFEHPHYHGPNQEHISYENGKKGC